MEKKHDITVLYNDTCPICSREIAQYRRQAKARDLPIRFAGLEQAARLGLEPDEAARRLHLHRDGQILAGIDAFAALWAALPGWRWLARVVRLPGLRWITGVVYDRVAAPLLYRAHLRRQSRVQSSDSPAA